METNAENLKRILAEDTAREMFAVIDDERNDLIYAIVTRAESTAMQMERAGLSIADGLADEIGRLLGAKVIQASHRVYADGRGS